MMILKGCPRCRGDLRTNKDYYGEYKQCIQCGYMEDLDPRNLQSATTKSGKKAA